MTLGTDKIGGLMTNWHVSDEISLSVHRYVVCEVGDLEVTRLTLCKPKGTNWESNPEDQNVNLGLYQEVYTQCGMYSQLMTHCKMPFSHPNIKTVQ